MYSSTMRVYGKSERAILACSAARVSRASARRSWRRSMPCSAWNWSARWCHDQVVEIVPAQACVAVGRADLDDALAQLDDRDVERAAAQVVDGHSSGPRRDRARTPALLAVGSLMMRTTSRPAISPGPGWPDERRP